MNGQLHRMPVNYSQYAPQAPLLATNYPTSHPMTPNPTGQNASSQGNIVSPSAVQYAPQMLMPGINPPLSPAQSPDHAGEGLVAQSAISNHNSAQYVTGRKRKHATLQAYYVAVQYVEGYREDIPVYQLPAVNPNQHGSMVVEFEDYNALYSNTLQRWPGLGNKSRFEVLLSKCEQRDQLVKRSAEHNNQLAEQLAKAQHELAACKRELDEIKQSVDTRLKAIDVEVEAKHKEAINQLNEQHQREVNDLVRAKQQLEAREQERLEALNTVRAREAQERLDKDLRTRTREAPPPYLNPEQRQAFVMEQTARLQTGGPQYAWLSNQPEAPKAYTDALAGGPIDGAAPCKKISKKRAAEHTDEDVELSRPAKKPRASTSTAITPAAPKVKAPPKVKEPRKPKEAAKGRKVKVSDDTQAGLQPVQSVPAKEAPATATYSKPAEPSKPHDDEDDDEDDDKEDDGYDFDAALGGCVEEKRLEESGEFEIELAPESQAGAEAAPAYSYHNRRYAQESDSESEEE